ncbi:MAG TPA: M28 family metallopeptidase [Pyrinomonadaceae bacterium]
MSAKPSLSAAVLLCLTLLAAAAPHARAQSVRGGQSPAPAEQPGGATPFNGPRAFEHVRKLVEFGPRPSGSKALERARRYIVEQVGGKLEEWVADTPAGRVKMANVVAEVKGETDDTIVIASHYDTKRFEEFDFVGANDGGSSTGALIEIARVLKLSGKPGRFTYRLVFFDGEEAVCREWDECGKPGAPDNTYGSRHHVSRLKARNLFGRVRAVVLLDMVGYEKLELGRDELSTPWLVDILWRTARELGHARHFVERAESVGGDDHVPFLRAGVPAVDLIQLGTYPHWHTPEDTLDKVAPSSLKAVGDVVLASLPRLEDRLRGEGAKKKAVGERRGAKF